MSIAFFHQSGVGGVGGGVELLWCNRPLDQKALPTPKHVFFILNSYDIKILGENWQIKGVSINLKYSKSAL